MRGLVVVGLQKLSLEDEEPLARPTLRLEGGGQKKRGRLFTAVLPFLSGGARKICWYSKLIFHLRDLSTL